MKYLSLVSCFVAIIINSFVLSNCYKKLTKNNDCDKEIYIVYVLLLSVITYFINYFIGLKIRVLFLYLNLCVFYKLVYKEKFSVTILKTIIIYLFLMISEIFMSILIMLIPGIKNINIEYIGYIKDLSTILDSLALIILFNIKLFTRNINKFINFIVSKINYVFFVVILTIYLFLDLIAFSNASSANLRSYFISILLLIIFFSLTVVMIYQYFKNKTAEKEQKQLLELMEEYENLLETGRENRHEMLNNLIVLKTEKNKASEKYEELLDDIIRQYQSKKSTNYSSLYKLPSGIKGIVYYKMANIKENEITFTSVISEEMYKLFDEMDTKLYYKVCKITGILIDNAIEASTVSDDKLLLVDIYKENNLINIYIENTFEGTVDINLINKKGFSTKGKNRGLGLHIVSTILRENDNLSLEQRVVNNKFVSILKIKL